MLLLSLFRPTSFKVTTLEEQLASAQQVCAEQQAQMLTLEGLLSNANQTAFSITALEQQLDAAQQIGTDQQAQLSILESQLADASQTAFKATAHVQQLAGAQEIFLDQAKQVQQLEDELDASHANMHMVKSIAALGLQLPEVGQTAQTQLELLSVKHQSQNETLQQQLR